MNRIAGQKPPIPFPSRQEAAMKEFHGMYDKLDRFNKRPPAAAMTCLEAFVLEGLAYLAGLRSTLSKKASGLMNSGPQTMVPCLRTGKRLPC